MTDAQLWSWIVTIVGLIGFIIAGRKVWWSWYVNLSAQALWVIYAIISSQPAFLVSAAVYTIVFGRNAYIWTRDRKRKSPPYTYTKRPVDIQAVRILDIDSENISFGGRSGEAAAPDWFIQAFNRGDIQVGQKDQENVLYVKTLEGEHIVRIGMWLIRGVEGELYGCDPEIFDKTYD